MRQALCRTVDPDLKTAWERARKALQEVGGRRGRRVISRGIYDNDEDRLRADAHRSRLEHDETERERAMLANFVSHLASSKLIATGSRGSPTAPRTVIPPFSWKDLGFKNWDRSIVMERTNEKIYWYGVTALPLLHSPSRASILTGLTLKEAFQTFVLDDPEHIARSMPILRTDPDYSRVFREGRYTVHGQEQWPVAPHSGYPCLTTRHPHLIARGPNDRAELADIIAAADVLHDRSQALFDALRHGELNVRAASAHNGHADNLLRSIWSHEDYYFEFKGGDVLQVNRASRDKWDDFKRVWLAAVLEAPSANQPVELVAKNNTAAGRGITRGRDRTTSRKADQIKIAAARAGVDVFDRTLSARKLADRLAPHMPTTPRLESELHALEKAISRVRVAEQRAS